MILSWLSLVNEREDLTGEINLSDLLNELDSCCSALTPIKIDIDIMISYNNQKLYHASALLVNH